MDCLTNTELTDDIAERSSVVLSAKELFQWRKKDNLPVPQRGGAKEYEPDGSWLEKKRLEAFYEEHLSVLGEPRVEKSGNIVKGTWNPEMGLVNIEKTAKFWMKMGFVDNQRNWLHPEEALFLMEVNCLDVMLHGLSLSLQEAYHLMLNPAGEISEEEYGVYAHLRRLGYIVVRHAGKLNLTPYERKIGIHQHSKNKNKRHPKKSDTAAKPCPSASSQVHSAVETVKSHEQNLKRKKSDESAEMHDEQQLLTVCGSSCDDKTGERFSLSSHAVAKTCLSSDQNSELVSVKEKLNVTTESCAPVQKILGKRKEMVNTGDNEILDSVGDEPSLKKMRTDFSGHEEISVVHSKQWQHQDPWHEAVSLSFEKPDTSSVTLWDFSVIHFPDIGGGRDTVALSIPSADCLPPNTCMNEEYEDMCIFDVEEYRQQQQLPSVEDSEDTSEHLKHLEFSYAEWYRDHSKRSTVKNWREWKAQLCQQENMILEESPVAHLWQGEITPLVQPKDSESTASLLDKLSVIQHYEGPCLCEQSLDPMKISFDVYLPNMSFKKSSPGPPDFRVSVSRGDRPPELFDVRTATAYLGDDVPLHWAVVNCGEISFFVFQELNLPVHPSSLG